MINNAIYCLQVIILEQLRGKITSEVESKCREKLHDLLSTTENPLNKDNILSSPGLWEYEKPLQLEYILLVLHSSGKVSSLKILVLQY